MFTKTKFESFDLKQNLHKGISDMGWEFVTQVQKETIPIALSGRDVIGQARTGSGKTASFGIPILNKCEASGNLQALILAPTRELANQVAEELNNLQGGLGLSIITVYGGTDLEKQAKQLQSGVDIVVGTPGRVMDMTKRGFLATSNAEFFVLDEADRMLDMGFFPDIMWILERMENRKQNLLFSATFPQEIIDAANEFTNDPEFVLTSTEKLDIPPIDQYSVRIGRANKLWVVGRLLSLMEEEDQTIIFTNTKRMVDLLVQRLKKHKFMAEGIHGDMTQNQRERIISDLKEGKSNIVIATDVAARGIDVEGINCVIHYDAPDDAKVYKHRSGRTARAGTTGIVISFVKGNEKRRYEQIQRNVGIKKRFTDPHPNDLEMKEFKLVEPRSKRIKNKPRRRNNQGNRRYSNRGNRRNSDREDGGGPRRRDFSRKGKRKKRFSNSNGSPKRWGEQKKGGKRQHSRRNKGERRRNNSRDLERSKR